MKTKQFPNLEGMCDGKITVGTCPVYDTKNCPKTCSYYLHRNEKEEAERDARSQLREIAVMGGVI